MMSPSEILARLDQRFRLLTGRSRDAADRHQTLQAAIDWSYALLDPAEEQSLLQRLSVFVGDFDLARDRAVGATPASRNSTRSTGSVRSWRNRWWNTARRRGGRYRLLETIRQYAADQLDAEGNAARRATCTPRITSP